MNDTTPRTELAGPDLLRALTTERQGLADLLAGLTAEQWATPTACPGWTVHDVAAHVTFPTRHRLTELLGGAVRARGNFDRMIRDVAVRRAAVSPPEALVAELRATSASTKRIPGTRPMDPLLDVVVHRQDIVRALGRTEPITAGLAIPCLTWVLTNPFYGGVRRAAGLALRADDVDWSSGSGDLVTGPVDDLLLALTGRPAALTARL